MKRLIDNLKIRHKLFVIISIFVFGFVSFGLYSYYSISKVKVQGPIYNEIIEGKDIVADILPPPEYIIESYLVTLELLNETNVADINSYIKDGERLKKDYLDRNAYWKNTLKDSELKKIFVEESYQYAIEFYDIRDKEFIPAILSGNKDKATILATGKLKDAYSKHREKIDQVVTLANNRNVETEEEASSFLKTTIGILIGLATIIIIVVIFLAAIISNTITRPIITTTEMLKDISEQHGDLTRRLEVSSKDEIGELAKYFNSFIENIHRIIESVMKESNSLEKLFFVMSDRIKELSSQIENVSNITEELTAGMEETAAATQEVSVSTIEIDNSVQTVAAKAEEGVNSATEISKRAVEINNKAIESEHNAREICNSTRDKLMDAITKAKDINQISQLLESILQISNKTNTLALNATIEASRAGEHGRGFAVVAEQVRRLAEDSKDSVSEIQKTVGGIVQSVEYLSTSSQKVLDFINGYVIKDYEVLVNTSGQYHQDAIYYNNLSDDFSDKAVELSKSIQNILKSIEEISNATNEGAVGTSEISKQTTIAFDKSNEVISKVNVAKDTVNSLMSMVSKFKI